MRELELEPGKKFKMITLASKPAIFGKWWNNFIEPFYHHIPNIYLYGKNRFRTFCGHDHDQLVLKLARSD